jgi:MoaA/NifB/PqqE/SkfB family radical SAM enzyme
MPWASPLERATRFDFVSKLAFFPGKVASTLAHDPRGALSVVYLDVNTDICNHACTFCDGYYRSLESGSIDIARLLRLVDEMEEIGVSAVVLAGDRGEPLMHPHAGRLLERLEASPIAVGLYTNGTVLSRGVEDRLAHLAWVRVSADAGTAATHRELHQYPEGRPDFERMLVTLGLLRDAAVEVGASFILEEANLHEIELGADVLLEAGASYVEYKPKYLPDYEVDTAWLLENGDAVRSALARARQRWGDRIVFNNQVSALLESSAIPDLRTVPRLCRTSLLRMVISTHGCYSCTPYRGDARRRFGDIRESSLAEILESPERKGLVDLLCDRICAYSDQNDHLLGLESGIVSLPTPARARDPQDAFV